MSNYTPEQIAAIQHEFIYGKASPSNRATVACQDVALVARKA